MDFNFPPSAVANLIESNIDRIDYAKKLGKDAGVKEELLNLYDEAHTEILKLKLFLEINRFSTDYAQVLAESLNKISSAFPTSYGTSRIYKPLQEEEKPIFKRQQENNEGKIQETLTQLRLVFDFFSKVDFFNTDLVIIGSNGAGKTFLASKIMDHVKRNGVIVSAQRILQLPEFNNIKSQTIATTELKRIHSMDREAGDLRFATSQEEFGIIVQHLLAEDAASLKVYRQKVQESNREGVAIEPPSPTKLERTLKVWNSVFDHLSISLEDGMNIKAQGPTSLFPAAEMSDGEKVSLFVIVKALQSPENGFIIVDEPELYLHPTIHKKLWDTIENERPDAIFIYLTHDLEFASSRFNAKKLRLRLFKYPDEFLLEDIPKNEIPQDLLMELLGSRQDILFCEGEIGSLDEQIYEILFSNYIIKPVGGCLSVINYTKAFNRLPMSVRRAVGIVDRDYLSQTRIEHLRRENVFPIYVPDIENILLDEKMLSSLALELGCEDEVDKVKEDTLKKLMMERDDQIVKYVSAKVDHYFKETNVASGDSLGILKGNYKSFIDNVDIESWAKERGREIDEVISRQDYAGALRIFKNKGLASIVSTHLGVREFSKRAIKLLRGNEILQTELRKYVPNLPIGLVS